MKGVDFDAIGKLAFTAVLFGWNVVEGAVFENEYPAGMVTLYQIPLWRLLLLAVLYLSADWCPSVSLMLAFFLFFYIMDMEVTLDKWEARDLKRAPRAEDAK